MIVKKNLHEFLHIHHNQNPDITLLEASITISVTFSVETLGSILLLYTTYRPGWKTPHTRKSLFQNIACLLIREFFGFQSNQWPNFHRPTPFLYKQFLNYCFLKSARELINNYDTASLTSTKKSTSCV